MAIRGLEKPFPIEYRDFGVDHALSGKGNGMNRDIREGPGIVLIHPPVVKACEAPGGPARLAGALRRHGVACRVWDANGEGQLALRVGDVVD